MVKRFCKGKPYTLCLIKNVGEEPYTWSVNATFSERLPDGTLKFRGFETDYLLHKDKSAEIVEDDDTHKCGWSNIISGWSY